MTVSMGTGGIGVGSRIKKGDKVRVVSEGPFWTVFKIGTIVTYTGEYVDSVRSGLCYYFRDESGWKQCLHPEHYQPPLTIEEEIDNIIIGDVLNG